MYQNIDKNIKKMKSSCRMFLKIILLLIFLDIYYVSSDHTTANFYCLKKPLTYYYRKNECVAKKYKHTTFVIVLSDKK